MRKIALCFGVAACSLAPVKAAFAQFAPSHTTQFLDERREDELRHRDMARMLMTMGENPGYVRPLVDVAVGPDITPYRPMPVHRRAYGSWIPAVVQVNREIGLSMTGAWNNYKEKGLYQGPFTGYNRENGWVPGFQADAAAMFDTYEVEHIFLALHFAFGDGSVKYRGSAQSFATGAISPFNSTSGSLTTDTRLEIGKGIMVTDRFMITPAMQGGYWSWRRAVGGSDMVSGSTETYGGFLAGITVRLDYALTDAFVVRGRLGWAELVGTRMNAVGQDGTFRLRPRPEWEASLGFDYRLMAALHWTIEAEYRYRSFGRSQNLLYRHALCCIYEPSSWSNGVQLRTGLAYAF
ncbi:hypothetical protein AA23498_0348 [Acetobacter nitrogenifigens DSM 23921 = NBRC 105050]|uniref:Outer membrane protein beta-barrel domain-containing protein n=1 Tax=Acetobacter nitrogenifigens DSM 23921 = NBRC 105050 TaxID=1120919 RepID=A0A511XAU0_9PROT|nr:hypothetical protein [Acetobacter nitrogenifigens]GBQ88315.1 hypothetical protein AA23498_0348 [Acetobacter nitrogenifigens DSM 23921 = NBRC 105050]GEN60083.1 hypothetical protein ANI02nite_19670 [Acetobacter nitrogenifigens DSM 23921 = NBRC 105050]